VPPSFDLLVIGDANPDLVLRGNVRPRFGQAENIVDDAKLTVGGSGAIMACGSARLGLAVSFSGAVGDDLFAQWIRDELIARRVGVDGLVVAPECPTGVTVVLAEGDDRAILTHPGTIATLEVTQLAPDLLADVRHVHVSSYFLQRVLAPDLPALFDEVHELGATTSLDPNWDPSGRWDGGLHDVLPRTDVFLPNAVEAASIAGIDDVEDAVRSLAGSAGLVVAKDGRGGALAAKGDRIHRAPGFDVDAVDATGAGDSFDAGFIAAWLAGATLERSLRIANACGALSTRGLGGVEAQPTMAEARDLAGSRQGPHEGER
jgi:sugar/nucleoside kinase (ribokinase family)